MADFVVTGTGRCGTGLCMIVLKQMGVPASHEAFFTLDRRSFDAGDRVAYDRHPTNDVALMAAPFLRQVGKPALHLVRNPLDVVNSFLHLQLSPTAPHEITDFINHFVTLEGDSAPELWADYWIKWNRMCAEEAAVTVQVEALSAGQISDVFLAPIIGVPGFAAQWQAAGRFKNRRHELTGNLVPPHVAERLRQAGEEYGYGR
jgi:hypothetical protein